MLVVGTRRPSSYIKVTYISTAHPRRTNVCLHYGVFLALSRRNLTVAHANHSVTSTVLSPPCASSLPFSSWNSDHTQFLSGPAMSMSIPSRAGSASCSSHSRSCAATLSGGSAKLSRPSATENGVCMVVLWRCLRKSIQNAEQSLFFFVSLAGLPYLSHMAALHASQHSTSVGMTRALCLPEAVAWA